MVNKPINNTSLGSFSSLRLVRVGSDFHRQFVSYVSRGLILGRDRVNSVSLECVLVENRSEPCGVRLGVYIESSPMSRLPNLASQLPKNTPH